MNYFEFSPAVEEMSFKRFLIWSSGAPCLVEWNHLCNFERWRHREHLCEVILNLDQRFRRRCNLKKKNMHDGHRPITIAHLEALAQVS